MLGVYDIPVSATPVTLQTYRVTDTNLANRFTFADKASVDAVQTANANAVFQSLLPSGIADGRVIGYDASNGRMKSTALRDVAGGAETTGNHGVTGTMTAAAYQGIRNQDVPATLDGKTLSNPTLSGTITGTLGNANLPSTITSKTLHNPAITGTVVGNTTFGGAVSAPSFVGNGAALTNIVGTGAGGSDSEGSLSMIANKNGASPGAILSGAIGPSGSRETVYEGYTNRYKLYKPLELPLLNNAAGAAAPDNTLYWNSDKLGLYYNLSGLPIRLHSYCTPKLHGAKGDGATNDSSAFASWATCGIKQKFLEPPDVSYKITQKINFEPDSEVFGVGAASLVDASLASFTGDTVFSSEGTITQIADLSANVTQGNFSITLTDASTVNVDDVLIIQNPTDYSWSGHRAYYRAGEMVRVRSKSGNTLGLWSPLYQGYNSADVDVFRITPRSAVFRDFKIKLNPSASGLTGVRFLAVTRGRISNVNNYNADYAALVVSRSFDVFVDCESIERGVANGDNYGAVVSSSQQVLLTGTFYAKRHGLALGNESTGISIPSRNIRVRNALVSGYGGEVLGADMHGAVEDVWYENCALPTGLIVSGRNVGARNCYIHAGDGVPTGTIGPIVEGSEMVSGFVRFENCTFVSGGGNTNGARGILEFGRNGGFATAATRGDVVIVVKNCTFDGRGITTDGLFDIYNNGSTYKINLDIEGLTLLNYAGDRIVQLGINSGTTAGDFVRIEGVAGIPNAAYLALISSGTAWQNTPMRLQSQSGAYSLAATTADSIVYGGNQALKWYYPKTPRLFLQNPTTAGVYAQAYIYSNDATQIRLTAKNPDAGNFAANVTFSIPYRVTIEDF